MELLGHDDVDIVTADTGKGALGDARAGWLRLRGTRPAPAGYDSVSNCWKRSQSEPVLRDVPIVVFTGKELTPEEDLQLRVWPRAWS